MRKVLLGLVLAACVVVIGGAAALAQEGQSTVVVMGKAEQLLYGSERTGGLVERLNAVEKELFGRELPGSIAERQTALLNFIEKGSSGQPSVLFKLGVAEWAVSRKIDVFSPVVKRVENLEIQLSGAPKVDKPVAMRLESLVNLLLTDGVTMQDAELPAATVIKASLVRTLSPKNVKKGDLVDLILESDLAEGTNLVAPKGSRVLAAVTSVSKPRSFGRPGEVKISVEKLFPLGGEEVPLTVGDASKKAAETHSSELAAAGTSFVGAILLGPVGLAGGFLVRGDVKEIPAGAALFAQTADVARVSSYPVPAGLQGMIQPAEVPVSGDVGADSGKGK